MIKTLMSIFAWETVWSTGVYGYQRNRITGKRRVVRISRSGHQPIDTHWLRRTDQDELDELLSASRELLSWYGPFNPTKHPPEVNGAWLRLENAVDQLNPE